MRGLLCLALAAGLAPFAVFGLLGWLLLPVGIILTAHGAVRRDNEDSRAAAAGSGVMRWVGAAGGALLAAGAAMLVSHTAHAAQMLALRPGLPASSPGVWPWLAAGAIGLAGSALIGATRKACGDTPARSARWFLATAAVSPGAALVFRLLGGALPLSA